MLQKLIWIAATLLSGYAFAAPTLTDLMAQQLCRPVAGKPNEFDCMVDQPDGSVKTTRYIQALNPKKKASTKSKKDDGSKLPEGKEVIYDGI